MRINNINNVNFKRALEITTNSNPFYMENKQNDKNGVVYQALDMIKHDKTDSFDCTTSRKGGEFMRKKLGDYNGKRGGILLKFINKKAYIFTGKETDEAGKIIKQSKKETEELNDKFEDSLNRQELYQLKKEVWQRRDKKLLELVEDGSNGKPYSKINIKTTGSRITEIEYLNTLFKDGFFISKSDSVKL